MTSYQYEKAFLAVAAMVLVTFLGALLYATLGMGIHVPARAGEIDPATIVSTPPFDRPSVRQLAPGRYEAVIVGRAWAFSPSEIRVPAGSEVIFRATSADVIHGLMIEGTRVNFMLVPGQVTELRYRFRERGEHLLICHEYCGVAHHTMFGKVIVE